MATTLHCILHPCQRSQACFSCLRSNRNHALLICDGATCQRLYHFDCLDPPLVAVPEGEWFCPACVSVSATSCLTPPLESSHPLNMVLLSPLSSPLPTTRFSRAYFPLSYNESHRKMSPLCPPVLRDAIVMSQNSCPSSPCTSLRILSDAPSPSAVSLSPVSSSSVLTVPPRSPLGRHPKEKFITDLCMNDVDLYQQDVSSVLDTHLGFRRLESHQETSCHSLTPPSLPYRLLDNDHREEEDNEEDVVEEDIDEDVAENFRHGLTPPSLPYRLLDNDHSEEEDNEEDAIEKDGVATIKEWSDTYRQGATPDDDQMKRGHPSLLAVLDNDFDTDGSTTTLGDDSPCKLFVVLDDLTNQDEMTLGLYDDPTVSLLNQNDFLKETVCLYPCKASKEVLVSPDIPIAPFTRLSLDASPSSSLVQRLIDMPVSSVDSLEETMRPFVEAMRMAPQPQPQPQHALQHLSNDHLWMVQEQKLLTNASRQEAFSPLRPYTSSSSNAKVIAMFHSIPVASSPLERSLQACVPNLMTSTLDQRASTSDRKRQADPTTPRRLPKRLKKTTGLQSWLPSWLTF